jgi:hypothetical protein
MPPASILSWMKINSMNPVLSDCHVFNLIMQVKQFILDLQAETEKPEKSRSNKYFCL